jgi:uncharacterized DUF497 family protein
MSLEFRWNPAKARSNLEKHRVAFEEALTVFGDPKSLSRFDHVHSTAEDRWVTIGRSVRGELVVVVHTEDDEIIRIISARLATKKEAHAYAQGL